MAETPTTIKQQIVGDLQLVIRAKNGGRSRVVNLGTVTIPYELDVTFVSSPGAPEGSPEGGETDG